MSTSPNQIEDTMQPQVERPEQPVALKLSWTNIDWVSYASGRSYVDLVTQLMRDEVDDVVSVVLVHLPLRDVVTRKTNFKQAQTIVREHLVKA